MTNWSQSLATIWGLKIPCQVDPGARRRSHQGLQESLLYCTSLFILYSFRWNNVSINFFACFDLQSYRSYLFLHAKSYLFLWLFATISTSSLFPQSTLSLSLDPPDSHLTIIWLSWLVTMRRDTASKMLVYRWDNFQNNILSSLHTMLETEDAMVKYSLTTLSHLTSVCFRWTMWPSLVREARWELTSLFFKQRVHSSGKTISL